ncbi:hypothetical protein [Pseudaquabacterium pictum]|uniref:Lipoprotein n=1 Tax=Pseudaquabacterium pictum TaxID=2315236 RepID=A0A480AJJ9_9BURK|nr:hypothetical protein [Rubrivivax pictus]GCL61711.1 hypothetical protein AQPW35_07920 [Rubrivivax pictus]
MLWGAAVLAVAALTGCAHPISLSTDASRLMGSGQVKVDRKVGLVVTDDQRKQEVVTPGGGGDKVSYLPYRDLEGGLYTVLSETFANVARVSGPSDPKIAAEGVNVLVVPVVSTTSFSPSIVTWPPTVFTVELNLSFNDLQNKPVTQVRVQGEGRAEFDEFKSDHSLAAKRAAEDALKKLLKAVAEAAARLK